LLIGTGDGVEMGSTFGKQALVHDDSLRNTLRSRIL